MQRFRSKAAIVALAASLAACSAPQPTGTLGPTLPPMRAGVDKVLAPKPLFPSGFGAFYRDARHPGGYPIGQIVKGPDGNLWFADSSSIGRITPSGKQTKFAPGAAGGIIANGPSKALWFTSFDSLGNPAISRITTSGSVKNFPIASGFVIALASGPDGNEWFADNGTDSIGKIAPTGTLADYKLPDGQTHMPVAIAGGPDGNVWFAATDFYGGAPEVGKVTPGGAVTEYSLSSCSGDSDSLALGSDGNLWTSAVCGGGYAMVGVTASGRISVYPVARPVIEMTIGFDGEIWGSFQKSIMEFDTTTHVQAPPIHTPDIKGHATFPWALAQGAGSDMWLTVNTSSAGFVGDYHRPVP